MGIVNTTPDSFSGDGVLDSQVAVNQALKQIEQSADIVDFGGMSTRPGHTEISQEDELKRVVPAIKLFREKSEAVISVDTTRSLIAREAIKAGADILNSIWGLSNELMSVVAEFKLPMVIMHNKEKPEYDGDPVDEIIRYLSEHALWAIKIGLKTEQIILDPGIGFGKLPEHNIAVLYSLRRFVELGFPTLIGTSRKSFIGNITGKSVEDREFGTAATVALAIANGIDIVRVHDVAHMSDVVKISDSLTRCSIPKPEAPQ